MIDFDRNSSLQLCYNHCYVDNPERFNQLSDCTRADSMARQNIAYLEGVIKRLKDYRVQVAERAALLETAPYTLRLSLSRVHEWDREKRKDLVFYRVRLTRVYLTDEIRPRDEINERFPGPERHKAKARFEALKKRYNGVETAVDIEKKPWEH